MRIFLVLCFILFTYGFDYDPRDIARTLLNKLKQAVTNKNANAATDLFAPHFRYSLPDENKTRIPILRDLYVGFWMFYHKTPIFKLESATWDGPVLRIKWKYEEDTGVKTVLMYSAEKIGNEYKITSGQQLSARTAVKDPRWTLTKNEKI